MKTACRSHAGLAVVLLLLCFSKSWADALPSLQLHIGEPTPANEFTRRPQLEWTAQPGVVYWLQSSTNPADTASWVTVEPVESKSFPVRWEGPELDAITRYYRLQAQPEIFSLEPSFIDSSDTNAVLYILGQLLPTNATVIINGMSFTPTIVNSNGVWATVRLNGLPPGVPVIGTITVIDNATSNIVATLPVQSPIVYGTELTTAQLQGPPEDPPASPAKKEFKGHVTLMKAFDDEEENDAAAARHTKTGHVTLLKRGGDDGSTAGARHTKSGHVTLLKRGDSTSGARMADALGGGKKEFKGHVTLLKREIPGGDPDDDDDGDLIDIDETLLMPALMKAKEKANRTKCGSNLRVNPASGELQTAEVDLAIPGRGLDFVWTRTYRSRTGPTTEQGAGWDFSYNVRLDSLTATTVTLHTGDGRSNTFYRDGTNGWFRDEYFLAIGDLDQDGIPDCVTFADGGQWRFHPPGTAASGKLHQIVDRNLNTMTFSYDGTGRLITIVDDLDRTNTVTYNLAGKIESITDLSGRTVRYEYNGNGDLVACVSPAVTGTPTGNDFPGGITNRYTYSSGNPDDRLNHNLTSCTDGKGQTWLQIFYFGTNNPASIDFDAVARLQRGVDKEDIRRSTVTGAPGNSFATIKVTLRDAVGNVTECFYDSRQRCVRQLDYTGRSNSDLPVTETDNRPTGKLRADDPDYFETKWTWNPDSLCTSEIRPNGDSTEIVHQRAQDHNSSRSNKTSRRHDGDVRVLRERASSPVDTDGDGVVDTSELVWRFEYDPRFGSPVPTAGKKLYVGNLPFSARGPRQSTSLDGSFVSDNTPIIRGSALGGNGVESAKVIVDRDTGRSKGFGFVISVTDPRGSVSTSQYDNNGNCTKSIKQGHYAVSNFHIEVDGAYNAFGQLTAVTNAADANGLRRVDTFSYHSSGPQAGYLSSISIDEPGVHLTTSFEYDARGNVTRCVDPRTNDWRFTFNALDQCVRTESPTNIVARCTTDSHYDENGNAVRTSTELRDETDTLVQQVNSFCGYDFLDRCTSVAGQVYKGYYVTNRFEYDPNGNLATYLSPNAASGVDPNSRRTFAYDERDLPFRSVAAPGTGLGATNQWDYDGNGNQKISKVDALVFKYVVYDGLDRPVSVTDAMSNVVIYAYDRNDNLTFARVYAETNDSPTSSGNLRYHEWRWRYDGFDRCVEASSLFFDPATQTPIGDGLALTRIAFAPIGQCSSVTDDNGHITTYGYDTAGRLSSITGPSAKTSFAILRDRCGNVTSCTQSDRSDIPGPVQTFVESFAYDSLNRCTADWNNVGNTNLYFYDSLARVVRSTDPKGVVSWAVYDDLSRLARSVVDLDGNTFPDLAVDVDTFWAYDENSRCMTRTDDNTNSTFYSYDSLDRCVMVTEADGTRCNLIWSPRSNLIWQQDANNTVVSNSFDLLDRCVRTDIIPGLGVAATTTFETFAYDGFSRLVAATNDTSHNEFAYDSMGNCVRSTSGGLGAICTFDGVGNRLSMTYPSGRLVTYTYDALDQLVTLSSAGGGLSPLTVTNAYEGLGRVGRIGRGNNVNTRIAWNGLVNPANPQGDFGWQQVNGINHQVAGGGAIIDRRVASFDRNQNKLIRAQTAPFFVGGAMTTNLFGYDALDRLTQFTHASGSPADFFLAYSLDGNGNRRLGISNGVAAPYIMDNTFPVPADFQVNQYTLTPFVLAPEQYDQNGNLIGRVTAAAQFVYQYDYADRLVQVMDFSSGVPALLASYSYDALGRRISKTLYASGLPPVTTLYTYGGGDDDCDGILETSTGGGNPVVYCYGAKAGKTGKAKRYDSGPDVPAARFSGTGQLQYYHCDDVGNVLALTDAAGSVIERYDYDDCGSPQFLTSDGFSMATNASPAGSPFLFRGMEWDAETGLYFENAGAAFASYKATQGKSGKAKNALRYADPRTGRGVTRGDDGGDANPWSQRSGINGINGGMPNRISMNVTVAKQTQGATFGEKVNAGLQAAGGARLINPIAMDKGLRFEAGNAAALPRSILKSFFETGDKPTQSQFKVQQYTAKQGKTGSAK